MWSGREPSRLRGKTSEPLGRDRRQIVYRVATLWAGVSLGLYANRESFLYGNHHKFHSHYNYALDVDRNANANNWGSEMKGRLLALVTEVVGIVAVFTGIGVEIAAGGHIGVILITAGSVIVAAGSLLWAKVLRR